MKKMEKHNYQVIVGNIGTIYEGTNGFEAIKEFNQYVAISKEGSGRAGGEEVTLIKNDEIEKEYFPPVLLKILSIDAWGNKKDGYEWNNWHTAGEISKDEFEALKTDKQIAVWFYEHGYTTHADMRKIVIDDDGYNVVICEKWSREPIFAIEYGPEY